MLPMKICPQESSAEVESIVRPATPDERRSLPLPPGPRSRFGSLWSWALSFPQFAERLQRKYGDLAWFRLPWTDCCIVTDPVLAAGILAKEGTLFMQGGAGIRMPRAPNQSVQGLHGEARRWRWEILRPAFTDEGLDEYEDIFVERVLAMQKPWRPGDKINIFQEVLRLMSAIHVSTFFGRDMDPPLNIIFDIRPPLKWGLILNYQPFPPALVRKVLPIRSIRDADGVLPKFDDLIARAIRRSRDPSFDGRDIVTRMVRGRAENSAGRCFTDDEIHDDVIMMLASGLGPTAGTVAWCLQYLAENPAARERLEREVDEVLDGKPIAAFDQKRLPYAHAVLKEGLRLAPPGYFTDKFATEDCVVGVHLIPKGTWVFPINGLVHRKAKYFERPHEFRPERWLDGRESELPSHAYWPYGYGYRTCLGHKYSTRVVVYCLASFAQRWRIEPVSRRPARPRFILPGPYKEAGQLARASHAAPLRRRRGNVSVPSSRTIRCQRQTDPGGREH